MAARPGEENVAILFGDVHYFYAPPDAEPRHHRFDKGSYVYLFENANERRCRIEIANHPGTDGQDAFDGFLDETHVGYSYKHHCMVSLTVAESVDQSEWHLPTYDPRNETKYHYKLHSLDIYFWTQHDALQFVNGIRRVLPPSHVEVSDEPGPPPQLAATSSVIQQLEKAAVSDPPYLASGSPEVSAVPPPASFAPMAYNPAAPAAPETVQHREKTPPLDEDPLNPLAVAVAYDYRKQPFTPAFSPPSQPGLGLTAMASPGLPPPPPPGPQRAVTMAGPAFSPPPPSQPATQPTPLVTPQGLSGPLPVRHASYSYGQQAPARPLMSQDYSIPQQVHRPTEAEMTPKSHQHQPKPEARGRLEENASKLERGVAGMLKKFEKKFG